MKKIYYKILWLIGLLRVYFFYFKVKNVVIKESYKTSKKILFIYSHSNSNRKDYDNEFYEVFRNAKLDASMLDIVEAQFSLFSFLRNIFLILRGPRLSDQPDALVSLSGNNLTILEIQNLMHEFNTILTFCDCFGADHLLAKAANSFSKETFTMQHGFYWMSLHARRENIAFKHFVSDYMLAWGQATVDEGENAKIDKSRFIIQGKFHRRIKSDFKELTAIGIFLNSSVDRIYNKKMIKICADVGRLHNIPIIIYKHPSDTYCYSNDVICKIIEDNERLLKPSFRVFISSGAILDLNCSKNIFFYDCEALPNSLKSNFLSFSSSAELSEFVHSSNELEFGDIAYISQKYSSYDFLGEADVL